MKFCANAIEVLAIFIDDLNSILFKLRAQRTNMFIVNMTMVVVNWSASNAEPENKIEVN